jgi:hypothetical protein
MAPRHRSAPRRLLARLVGRRRPRQVLFDLDLSFPEAQFDLSRLPSGELVIALSALEARYLPEVVHRVRAPLPLDLKAWPDYANDFDPTAMLGWLGWQPEQLKAAAYRLLSHAYSIDPQQRWHRLARLAEPERWGELRGLALAANDHRVAAELLLLFYEDLVELGAAPPLEQLPPRHQRVWHQLDERLASDRDELEEVLTEFGLSPHPSVVLGVEGETEELTVGRIIDLLVPDRATSRRWSRCAPGTPRLSWPTSPTRSWARPRWPNAVPAITSPSRTWRARSTRSEPPPGSST